MEKPVYRILDANFNRAREALRTMEEYCRFVLANTELSSRAKALRHQLCTAAGQYGRDALLAARDSSADVGRGLKVEGQHSRRSLEDGFTAAAMRLSEALRAMAEFSQSEYPDVYRQLEDIRFDGYSFEKEVAGRIPIIRYKNVKLYVLLTVTMEKEYSHALKLTEQIAQGGADAIQLRAKGIRDDDLYKLSGRFVEICRENSVFSIINDRSDIAALTEADGLHLGQEDIPVSQAKRLLLRPAVVGLSTHNESELQSAIAQKADYVGIGPMFPSQTKPDLAASGLNYARRALEILKTASIFHVAIGGINLDNISHLLEAGIKAVAIGAAICEDTDPKKKTRVFKDKICKLLVQKDEDK